MMNLNSKFKTTMSFKMATALLVFSGCNVSHAFDSDLVVKLSSKVCNQSNTELKGSGVLFSYGSDKYVITSDHVIINENKGICHRAWNSQNKEMPLTLISSDWASGLALLKVTSFSGSSFPLSLDEMLPNASATIKSAEAIGYPTASNQALSDKQGHVVMQRSTRHLFANLNYVLEVSGLHNEFGMSGGALADSSSNQLYGILSHQILRPQPGRDAQVLNISSQISSSDLLLVIPTSEVRPWVLKQLVNPSNGEFQVTALDQISKSENINGYGLKFSMKHDAPKKVLLAYIGGDPVGIGGSSDQDFSNSIVIEKSDLKTLTSLASNTNNPDWISKIQYALQRNERIEIPYLVETDLQNLSIRPIAITSFAEFIRQTRSSNVQPVMLIQNNPNADVNSRNKGAELQAKLLAVSSNFTPATPEDLNSWAQINLVAQIAAQGCGNLVDDSIMSTLTKATVWNSILINQKSFNPGVEALTALTELSSMLKKERL